MTSLDDLRVCLTDTPDPTLVAIGFGAEVEARAQEYSRSHNVSVNLLAPKDGFELRSKMSPSGMRVDVTSPRPPEPKGGK